MKPKLKPESTHYWNLKQNPKETLHDTLNQPHLNVLKSWENKFWEEIPSWNPEENWN